MFKKLLNFKRPAYLLWFKYSDSKYEMSLQVNNSVCDSMSMIFNVSRKCYMLEVLIRNVADPLQMSYNGSGWQKWQLVYWDIKALTAAQN